VQLRSYEITCAYTLRTAVSTVTNLVLLPVGYIWDPIGSGFMFAMMVLTSYHDLQEFISANTHINRHIWMQKYDSNCTSSTNWFHLAGTHCYLSKPEPVNAFESISELLNTELADLTLPAYFWEQSDVPSRWNIYWTEAPAYGGGLELDDPVYASSWTRYWGAHTWFDCNPELPCECEGHHCFGTHSTEGHAPAAAATAMPAPVPLIVIKLRPRLPQK